MSDPSVFGFSDPESNELAMLDALAASGTDMSKMWPVDARLDFDSMRSAKRCAIDLLDYREVHLVQADVGPLVEVVTHVAPKVTEIHDFRVKLSKLAASRSGSWLGTHVVARPPKIADKS